MDKEQALLQALWKKAATMDKPLEIPHKHESDAKRRRFQLYNAVKKVKDQPHLDPELAEAARSCSISFKDKTTLLLGHKQPAEDLIALAESLGITVESVSAAPSETDFAIQESMRKLQESMTKESKTPVDAAAEAVRNRYGIRKE